MCLDIDLLIIGADSPEDVRNWLEQLQPLHIPTLAVTTTASAPFLQASADSQQLAGVLSGTAATAAYQQRLNDTLPREWNIYATAIVLTISVLLSGLLSAGLQTLMRRANKAKL
jgi:hypothetical protein